MDWTASTWKPSAGVSNTAPPAAFTLSIMSWKKCALPLTIKFFVFTVPLLVIVVVFVSPLTLRLPSMVVFFNEVSPETFRFPSFSMFFDMILSSAALIAWSVFALIMLALIDEFDASISPFISCVPSNRFPHK